jgi:hypothetical protein
MPRVSGSSNLREYARIGAQQRLVALRAEQEDILRIFPELGRGRQPKTGKADGAASARNRRSMSAAQRKAVGERMKAYWAARRAEKASQDGSTETAGQNGQRSHSSGRKGGRRKQGRKK